VRINDRVRYLASCRGNNEGRKKGTTTRLGLLLITVMSRGLFTKAVSRLLKQGKGVSQRGTKLESLVSWGKGTGGGNQRTGTTVVKKRDQKMEEDNLIGARGDFKSLFRGKPWRWPRNGRPDKRWEKTALRRFHSNDKSEAEKKRVPVTALRTNYT